MEDTTTHSEDEGVVGCQQQPNDKEWPTLAAATQPIRHKQGTQPTQKAVTAASLTSVQYISIGSPYDTVTSAQLDRDGIKGKKQRLEKSADKVPDPKRTRNRYDANRKDSL